jgi:uncharacterized membrane protein
MNPVDPLDRLQHLGDEAAQQYAHRSMSNVEERASKYRSRRSRQQLGFALVAIGVAIPTVLQTRSSTPSLRVEVGAPTTNPTLEVRSVRGQALENISARNIEIANGGAVLVGPVRVNAPTSPTFATKSVRVTATLRIPPAGNETKPAGGAWQELIVTTANRPTNPRRDRLFGMEEFANHSTFGCRFAADATVTCALYDASDGKQIGGGRIAQWSWFEAANATVVGGRPDKLHQWPTCSAQERFAACTARVEIELSSDSFRVLLNGAPYFGVTAIPMKSRIPARLLGDSAYTFVGATASTGPTRVRIDALVAVAEPT